MSLACRSCAASARYAVVRPAGMKDEEPQTVTRYACGRHLSSTVDFMTVPGRMVSVVRIRHEQGDRDG